MEDPHRQMKTENAIPLVAFDYARTKPGVKPILVAKCGTTGNVGMWIVSKKGVCDDAVHFMVSFILKLGHTKVRLKDDPEISALELRDEVLRVLRRNKVTADIERDRSHCLSKSFLKDLLWEASKAMAWQSDKFRCA